MKNIIFKIREICIFVIMITMVLQGQVYANTGEAVGGGAVNDIMEAGINEAVPVTGKTGNGKADAGEAGEYENGSDGAAAGMTGAGDTGIDESEESIETVCSSALVNLSILRGNENGELNLQNNITRREMIVLVNRMMAYEYFEGGVSENNGQVVEIPFKDVSQADWAYNDIRVALKYQLIKGYTDNTLRPDNHISLVEACALLLRALGYEKTIYKGWPEGVLEKSKELGLDKNLDLPGDKIITRGEASILIYNALSIKFVE
ncbi:MAG: S-layer homology domain-containing protein [Clostridiaceae bacterium]|nr:S-layer homology domain-containing protein [Clostridiaceae bacterium]